MATRQKNSPRKQIRHSGIHYSGEFFWVFLLVIFIPIFISISPIVYSATVPDLFSGGIGNINDFLTRESLYPKVIDFVFFALLFISVYQIGAKYAFKEMKRPEQMIVILLGLATAYLLVLADVSLTY